MRVAREIKKYERRNTRSEIRDVLLCALRGRLRNTKDEIRDQKYEMFYYALCARACVLRFALNGGGLT